MTDTQIRPTCAQVIGALEAARALVEFDGWCQSRHHAVVGGKDHWSALGALSRVCQPIRVSEREVVPGDWLYHAAYIPLAAEVSRGTVSRFNDLATREEVVALYRRAIAAVWDAVAA